jgi:hypothetical protein
MTPYQDPTPYRNFRNVIHTCLSCIYIQIYWGGKMNCSKTINQPTPNGICDEYMALTYWWNRGTNNDQ